MEKVTLETKIKDWYINEYPHEINGNEMNSTITFEEFDKLIWANYDVYELMRVKDDTMRIRLFKELAYIKNVTYENIKNRWIFSDL